MPPPRPNRAPPPRPAAAKAGSPPPPPAPGTVKPSTRVSAVKPAAKPAATRPPPPPASPAQVAPAPRPASARMPAASRSARARLTPAPMPEDDDVEVERPVTSRSRRAGSSGGNRRLILVIAGLGVALVAIVALAMAWGPMQRSKQLATIDACRAPERVEEGRQLAMAYAQEWGPRSEYVIAAITGGHGSPEARVEMCRVGGHMRLLAQMLADDKLTPAQRGLVCAALSELWPDDGSGPGVSPSLPAWALAPESEPELAEPALRLLVSIAAADSQDHLARAAADGRLKPERALAAAVALGLVAEKRSSGVGSLVAALGGAHRSVLLASPAIAAAIANNAIPADAAKLVGLLAKPDSIAIGLAGLGGKRFQIGDGDAKARAELTAQLLPFLTASADDAVLAGALMVVHRQRLIAARNQVIALLPRLAKRKPTQLSKDDLADLLGKSLVSTRTPEAATAAEEVVAALGEALDKAGTRNLAVVALSRVQEQNVASLRIALDGLAGCGEDGASALEILVGKVYGREDIAKAGRARGWNAVLADDRRKRARHDAIVRWLSDHAEENNARVASDVMAANKTELGRMRDEVRGWMESKDPLPLGVSKAGLDELSNRVQLMLNMVIKGTHAN